MNKKNNETKIPNAAKGFRPGSEAESGRKMQLKKSHCFNYAFSVCR